MAFLKTLNSLEAGMRKGSVSSQSWFRTVIHSIYLSKMVVLSQTHSGIMLLAAGAIFGLGYGNFQSCAQAIALKGISVERLGIATSTFYIFLDSGLGFGPYFLGVVVPNLGYRGMYEALTVVILLSLAAFIYLFRKRKEEVLDNA